MTDTVELPDFSHLRVAVVGDLIADHYLYAAPRRLSREAPVMVLSWEREEVGAGGGANVARNLRALGAQVRVVGIVGDDDSGREVTTLLRQQGVEVGGVTALPGWRTPTKTRILAAEPRRSLQQVLRIDREPAALVSEEVQHDVARRLVSIGDEVDAVLVADYEYGMVGDPVGHAVQELARRGKVVVLDPRSITPSFRGVTALTPNLSELARFSGVGNEGFDPSAPEGASEPDRLPHAAADLIARTECRYLLLTLGNRGMQLFGRGLPAAGVRVAASGQDEVTDVCGAGDTAASVFALALASGCDPVQSMVMANAASGVVVLEHGAAVCTTSELRAALSRAPVPAQGWDEVQPAARMGGGEPRLGAQAAPGSPRGEAGPQRAESGALLRDERPAASAGRPDRR